METKENRDGLVPVKLTATEVNLRMKERVATLGKTIYGENTPVIFVFAECDDTGWWIDWHLMVVGSQLMLRFSEGDIISMMEHGGTFQGTLYRDSATVYEITVEAPDPSNNDEAKQNMQAPMESERLQKRMSLVGRTVRVEWYDSVFMQGWHNSDHISCCPSFCVTTGVVIDERDLAIVLGPTAKEGTCRDDNDLYSPVIIARGAIARIEKLNVSEVIPNDVWQQH